MPARTYTGIDLTGYGTVDGTSKVETNGTVTITPTLTSQAVVSLGAVGNAPSGNGFTIRAAGPYNISGNLPYASLFPTIPEDALIQSITVKMAATISGSATGTFPAPSEGSCRSGGTVTIQIGATLLNTLTITQQNDSAGGSGTKNTSVSQTRTFSTTQILDFTGAPITRAQLIANYTALLIILNLSTNDSKHAIGGPPVGTGSFNVTVAINNFEVQVAYTGPAITLSPQGGNVESGQSIVVTGNGVQDLEYSALQGDNVIPLEPKKNSNGTVTLTVPNPSDSNCVAALVDCPECEDCLDACTADLEGEDCQDCLQACLDCLAAVFESIDLAEECNESTHEPPGNVPIIIICGGPPFSGSVPLGTFTILETNGSGVYQFQNGKTNDTLYSSTRDGTTYNVKIPNPFGKTGFFRS